MKNAGHTKKQKRNIKMKDEQLGTVSIKDAFCIKCKNENFCKTENTSCFVTEGNEVIAMEYEPKKEKFKEGDIVIVDGEWDGFSFVNEDGVVKSIRKGYLTVEFKDETWEVPIAMCEKAVFNIEDEKQDYLYKTLFGESDYSALEEVLDDALEQSESGKGKERHANNNRYEDQVICVVQRLLKDHPFGGHAYQIIKKTIEAGRLYKIKGKEAAYQEMLGAINYAGAMNILIKEEE
jgi:hypothetical protein